MTMSVVEAPRSDRLARPNERSLQTSSPISAFSDRLVTAPLRRLEAREHLWCEGDARTHVYRVETGAVCIYKVLPDGRRHVVDFAFAGDLIGLGLNEEHSFNAQALIATRLKGLTIGAFNQALRVDSQLALQLYEALSQELEAARAQLLMVSKRVSTERVASFLVTLSRRNEKRGADPCLVPLPMRRVDIADFLGLTIETVSRTFTKLKTSRVISLLPGNIVRILDTHRLAELAAGDAEGDAA
jgi:CRP/FNR family transcriptional regulator